MKTTILQAACLAAALCGAIAIGCNKNNNSPAPNTATCTGCVSMPEAKAANDNSSRGIYKGIIAGLPGTVKFDIMNTDSTVNAYMTIDGESVVLTASSVTITGPLTAVLTGAMTGGWASITLTVNEDGSNPVITALSLPGHPNARLTLIKETSANLVKCYEGTYTNTISGKNGTFNLTLSTAQKVWIAQTGADGDKQSPLVGGIVDGDIIKFDDGNGSSGSAKLTNKKIGDGTWQNTCSSEKGTWKAVRTL